MVIGLREFGEFLLPFFIFLLYVIALKIVLKVKLSKALCKGFFLTTYAVMFEFIVTIATNYLLFSRTNGTQALIIHSFETLCTITYISGILFFYITSIKKRENLLMAQRENEKLKTELTYYGILERQSNELLSFAHDIKNHLIIIKDLNSDKEIDEYISKMLELTSNPKRISNSGNKFLDIIINRYYNECAVKEIEFTFDVLNNNFLDFDSHDTVTVFGNLIDNAVEAAEKSERKIVSLITDNKNGYSIIIITNSCDYQPEFTGDNIPVSTKSASEYHGIGIKNVKNVLKKYDGDVEFIYDTNKRLFTVTVMIKI